MPTLSLFTRPCHLALSSKPPRALGYYREIIASYGKAYDFTPEDPSQGDPPNHNEASAFARAMALARARNALERAGNQMRGATALDLLLLKAADWGVIPTSVDTVRSLQLKIAAKQLLRRGARFEAMVAGLRAAIGPAFIAYRPLTTSEATVYPTWPSVAARQKANPTLPLPTTKTCALVDPIGVTGSPLAVTYQNIDLRAGEVDLAAGDVVMVQPENGVLSEKVKVTAATRALPWAPSASYALGAVVLPASSSTGFYYTCVRAGAGGALEPSWPVDIGDSVADGAATLECMGAVPAPRTFTATFTKGHDEGAIVTTASWPYQWSTQHFVFVIVTPAAAVDAELRREVNEFMQKSARGVGLWAIVAPSSPGKIGPFAPDASPMGTVPIGAFAYVPST